MADNRQKAKSPSQRGVRNDERKNGKAWKKHPKKQDVAKNLTDEQINARTARDLERQRVAQERRDREAAAEVERKARVKRQQAAKKAAATRAKNKDRLKALHQEA